MRVRFLRLLLDPNAGEGGGSSDADAAAADSTAVAKGDGDAGAKAEAHTEKESLFTAEEYQDYLALKTKVAGFDETLKKALSETEREKLRLKAEKDDADRKLSAAEKAKSDEAAKLQKQLGDLQKQWVESERIIGEDKVAAAIAAKTAGLQFVGKDDATRNDAAATFAEIAKGKLKPVKVDGRWEVRGVEGDKPADEVLADLIKTKGYLFARRGDGGFDAGGNVPPDTAKLNDETEAIFSGWNAANQQSDRGLWPVQRN